MRLIDADKLTEELGKCLYDTTNPVARRTAHDTMALCQSLVDEQPTVYDVDKVIEQLEKTRDTISQNIALNSQEDNIDEEILNKISQYQKIIQIVKSGGIMKRPSPDPSGYQRGTLIMPLDHPLVFPAK